MKVVSPSWFHQRARFWLVNFCYQTYFVFCTFLDGSRFFKNVFTFLYLFLRSKYILHISHFTSSLLIRKSFLINLSLFQLPFQYSLSYFAVVSLYSQETCCIRFSHLYQFLYRNYHSITKKDRVISFHSLILG